MGRTEQYLNFLLWVVRSDGNIALGQRDRLLAVMIEGMDLRKELVDHYRVELSRETWDDPTDEELTELAANLDELSLGNLVRDGYLMAWADGVLREVEVVFIKRFLGASGIPQERHGEIDKWARRAVELNNEAFELFARG
jgi:uncharacterized tellurite resistance protein B-like protein